MRHRPLGKSGLKVSVLGLGSWITFGGSVDSLGVKSIVRRAFEGGINFFDTADVYLNGIGEQALGAAIADLPRHRLVLASKCFFPMSEDVNDRGLSRKHVHESLDASLRRMRIDYLDLYQCHRFDPDTPLHETAAAMDDLIRRGKVLYWGVSMWPAERITEVVELCRREGMHAPISNQPLYNLFERGIESAVIPASERAGVGQVVYSPLAQGVLSGKYGPAGAAPAGTRAADPKAGQFVDRYLTPERRALAVRYVEWARSTGRDPLVTALAFCLRKPNVSSAIVGARSLEQLDALLPAGDMELDAATTAELERMFPA